MGAAETKEDKPAEEEVQEGIVGNQPEGHMNWVYSSDKIPGYSHSGSIHIFFEFEDGIQEDTHPNPGMPYTGLKTIAYLPDNADGQKVVTRLKKAFDQRVVFTVQRNGKGEDTVVPCDIPLKTYFDTSGPPRLSYPDSTYLKTVKKMLKSRGFH